MSERLEIVPVTFRQAQAFIAEHHRHHKPPRGNWAESSVMLRNLRDPVGTGGVQRTLWEAAS